MIRHERLCLFFACALLFLSAPRMGFTDDTSDKEIKIGFAVLLHDADPIAGTALCKIGRTCRLLKQEEPKLIVDLKIDHQNDRIVSEMQVDCERDCSLANGRSAMKLQWHRELDLFSGEETGIFTQLVSRPRETIGKILLIYPDP
ncbi:MAG: hypothetical protein DI595_21685 [Agrobacterium fabrum]|uniref:Uncharacterized protein n=1 Tax=Agrobacterium fabrum TaxID=1176649 RepID=A0A2W5EFX7_9HYPH|nr:MAG: hypothetical protein DI595_21685 [Agrobacterium fabrum]